MDGTTGTVAVSGDASASSNGKVEATETRTAQCNKEEFGRGRHRRSFATKNDCGTNSRSKCSDSNTGGAGVDGSGVEDFSGRGEDIHFDGPAGAALNGASEHQGL